MSTLILYSKFDKYNLKKRGDYKYSNSRPFIYYHYVGYVHQFIVTPSMVCCGVVLKIRFIWNSTRLWGSHCHQINTQMLMVKIYTGWSS